METKIENAVDSIEDTTSCSKMEIRTCPFVSNNQVDNNMAEDLRHFDVLDEVQGDESGSDNEQNGNKSTCLYITMPL